MNITRMLVQEQLFKSGQFPNLQNDEVSIAPTTSPLRSFWLWALIVAIIIGGLFYALIIKRNERKEPLLKEQLQELEKENHLLLSELQQRNLELSYLALSSVQKSEFFRKTTAWH